MFHFYGNRQGLFQDKEMFFGNAKNCVYGTGTGITGKYRNAHFV